VALQAREPRVVRHTQQQRCGRSSLADWPTTWGRLAKIDIAASR
jgi:hypothetical protein